MSEPTHQRHTVRDWVLGLVVFIAMGAATVALNKFANSYLPEPKGWVKTFGTVAVIALAAWQLRERFKAQNRRKC